MKIKMWSEVKINKSTIFNSDIISLQGFFFEKTDFHFYQFLFNFFRYFSSNFLSFYPYNIFAVYFSSNFPLLKSLSSTISCLLTSALSLLTNSATTSFIFSKSSPLYHVSYFTMNSFHYIKYFTTPLIFLLFRIFSTSHSSTLFTSTSFTSSTFCSPTCSLYHTTWLIFITR